LSLKQQFVESFFLLITANVTYFQRKIQLSLFSAYPDGSSSQLIRICGVLLHFQSAALNQAILQLSFPIHTTFITFFRTGFMSMLHVLAKY